MRVITTDGGASLPAKYGQAELLNSSLGKYPELTICARFLTHHFSTHSDGEPSQDLISYGKDSLLSSYVAGPCDQFYQGCTEDYREKVEGDQWIRGKVFGSLYLSGKDYDYFYPVWWPEVWNSACIIVRASQHHYRVDININGQNVIQSEAIKEDFLNSSKARIEVEQSHIHSVSLSGTMGQTYFFLRFYYFLHFDSPQNIVLMNSPWKEPHHGAVTDVNIWDRILSSQEQSDWMFCETETGGNVVSWGSAQLNITGLNTDLVNREQTCPGHQNITHFMAFNTTLNFHDSIREAFIRKTSINEWTLMRGIFLNEYLL